ncbi:hypothetical protein [Ulvibacterium marinum]|uniref:Lipocalin-like domain-containing protein n=1 Tax=Ulvibacterium marinum TaxID=2419782 RepID=A0A3B0C6Q6_9FLAO|nr:hypothetical protein [Ulvibacterium marinum]RKN80044.1 hypothetical protein D7Z94_17530 [Ulvibacterium marinum]
MKKSILLLFLATGFFFTSCNKDDSDSNNSDNSSLLDKWWFDSNNVIADIYFHSDGKYEQRIVLLGNEFTGSGDWAWEDENSGIMKIENLEGSGQIATSVWFKISDIQKNTFALQQSINGTDYTKEVFYQDTEE